MIPSSWATVLAFLFALSPGLLFDSVARKRRPGERRSTFREIAQIVLVSTVSVGIAAPILMLLQNVSEKRKEFSIGVPFADLLFFSGEDVRKAPTGVVVTLTLLLLLTLAVALAGVYVFVPKGETTHDVDTVWRKSFAVSAPKGTKPFAVVGLKDGRTVEGHLASWTSDPLASSRDIALARPLYVRDKRRRTRKNVPSKIERIVLNEAEISAISLKYLTKQQLIALAADQDVQETLAAAAASATASAPAP